MEQLKADFIQYKKLLELIVWQVFVKYRMPTDQFEDLQGIAYYVFCLTAQRFDKTKHFSFTTYLYPCVKGYLQDYCNREYKNRINNVYVPDEWFDKSIFHDVSRKIEYSNLSGDAKSIVDYLLSFEWHKPGEVKRLPRFKATLERFKEKYNWNPARVRNAWQEIKTWWNKEAHYA